MTYQICRELRKECENKIAKARIELQKYRANKDRILRPFAGKGAGNYKDTNK